jgi:hypothetical protein
MKNIWEKQLQIIFFFFKKKKREKKQEKGYEERTKNIGETWQHDHEENY